MFRCNLCWRWWRVMRWSRLSKYSPILICSSMLGSFISYFSISDIFKTLFLPAPPGDDNSRCSRNFLSSIKYLKKCGFNLGLNENCGNLWDTSFPASLLSVIATACSQANVMLRINLSAATLYIFAVSNSLPGSTKLWNVPLAWLRIPTLSYPSCGVSTGSSYFSKSSLSLRCSQSFSTFKIFYWLTMG